MIHLLVGANSQQAKRWMQHRLLHHTELGKTVLSSRIHGPLDQLRGIREKVMVVHLEDDGRPFAHYFTLHDEYAVREARMMNYRL